MGKVYTPTTITDINDLSSINQNFTDIEAALQDAVSRSGALPNHMTADLDLNNNNILNTLNLPITPDVYVDGASFLGTVLQLSRTGGLGDLSIDLGSLAGPGVAFRGALASRSTSVVVADAGNIVYNNTDYDTDSIFNGTHSMVIPSGVTRARFAAGIETIDNLAVNTQMSIQIYNASAANIGAGDFRYALNDSSVIGMNTMSGAMVVTPGHSWRVRWNQGDLGSKTLDAAGSGTWFAMEILA